MNGSNNNRRQLWESNMGVPPYICPDIIVVVMYFFFLSSYVRREDDIFKLAKVVVVVNLYIFFLTKYKSAKVLQGEDGNLWRPTISLLCLPEGQNVRRGGGSNEVI